MIKDAYIDPYSRPYVYFVGIDRTGKTTTRKAFAKATNEECITYDRSAIENLVYDTMFRNAQFSDEYVHKYFLRMAAPGNIFIVFMDLNFETINERYLKTEGGHYEDIELQQVRDLFLKYLEIADRYVTVLHIDCDDKSVDDIVKEVKDKIERRP